jgi:class 3 adenylate cyclase
MSFQSIVEIEKSLKPNASPSVRDLYNIWDQRLPVDTTVAKPGHSDERDDPSRALQFRWLQSNISTATGFLEKALRQEEFLLVCDAYREAIAFWQKQENVDTAKMVKLHSNYATALTRLGFTRAALKGLKPHTDDPNLGSREQAEVLLQLGDILREESHHAPAAAAQKATAEDAQGYYKKALDLDPTLTEAHALNAAMALILSEKESPQRLQAEELGQQVLGLLVAEENTKPPSFHSSWFKAVAYTVMARTQEAAAEYAKLKTYPAVTTADLAEVRYRAQFLAAALGEKLDFFHEAFPPLQLIVFAGHNADLPEMPARFPAESIPIVQALLREKLKAMEARVGLVSAAAGADLLFIEALREQPDATYHVVLPWSKDEFFLTSVEPYDKAQPEPFWQPRFKEALKKSATIRELGQVFEPGDDVGWEYTQEVTAGLALLTARISRLDVQPIALWDGNIGRGAGGTASFIALWEHYLKQRPIIIDLPKAATSCPVSIRSGHLRCEKDSLHQEVKSMLFADIVGYSKLSEKVIREFVEIFMLRLSDLLSRSLYAPRNVNTWGDAIYAVFDYAEDAGRFALELTKMIQDGEKDWVQKGIFHSEYDAEHGQVIKRPLNIRVGLHTGPVFAHYNPILRQLGFTGSQVSRAARIEPVATPGEVYSSEEFAAMAELGAQIRLKKPDLNQPRWDKADGFVCEYAGSMALAKNYPGRYRIYRVIPHRVLAMEELAMAAHALYCREQEKITDPKDKADPASLLPWERLAEDLRDANRAQVADLPNKLYLLGYELAPSHGLSPLEIRPSAEQVKELAIREHDRWMAERMRQGWVYGTPRDNVRKHHPLLVPWEKLPDNQKNKDRDTITNLPALIEKAGFRVRKIAQA